MATDKMIQRMCAQECVTCYCVLPVDINGLEQAESHPGPQEEHVVTEDHDANEESSTQDDSLKRMSVFCLHTKRSLENSGDTVTYVTFSYEWELQRP